MENETYLKLFKFYFLRNKMETEIFTMQSYQIIGTIWKLKHFYSILIPSFLTVSKVCSAKM